jgi:hypothetical protein
MTPPTPLLTYVTAGGRCLGHILVRGKAGFEAFD